MINTQQILLIFSTIINIILLVLLAYPKSNSNTYTKLESYMNDNIKCPKLEKNGVVRVYVSAGMFDLADTIYAVGPDGLKPGLDYQSINLLDIICRFSDEQWGELSKLCKTWDVPWYGICGEIEKMGWECYCPVRDGLTMATVSAAIGKCSYEDVIKEYDASDVRGWTKKWDDSLFNIKNISKTTSDKDKIVQTAQGQMYNALGLNVGANDLFNMYATCNCCIMNYNGIQADAGALAEIGQLGARGVPCVIIKGTLTGDFGGATNPMPTMATSAKNKLYPHLTSSNVSVFGSVGAALPALQAKVNRFINANESGLSESDPFTIGNYNNNMPLPPLQIFWTDLGSKAYFLKHRTKSIATLSNGKCNFAKDYTTFWQKNVVESKGATGLVQAAKAMADNLDDLMNDPKYKNVIEYWT